MFPSLAFVVALNAVLTSCQLVNDPPPSSWPHVYPGQPSGDLSPAWQNYYEVKDSLPSINFPLNRSFAGNIPVNRAGHTNDTLFFWAFEKQNGSLTATTSSDPWVIWLQGGPGTSSMLGLALENGPFLIQEDRSVKPNPYTWANLADTIWVDNPVGVGFSTADSNGYVVDAEHAGVEFVQFLANLAKVFPSLATRPLYITGESYAGRWIPYITKAILSIPNPPVKLKKIAIGNGVMGSFPVAWDVPIISKLETYPQIVNYDTQVLEYFREQTHLCGYDLNLTYPGTGPLPMLRTPEPSDPNSPYTLSPSLSSSSLAAHSMKKRKVMNYARYTAGQWKREVRRDMSKWKLNREAKKETWKRDLSLRANGTIDPWYACNLLAELFSYMENYTAPWNLGNLNIYDLSDGLSHKISDFDVPLPFFTDTLTINAIHAPGSKVWSPGEPYPFNNTYEIGNTFYGDYSPDPQDFMSELASNASALGVEIVLYSGNDDGLVTHRGTEVTIQNTTFGGIQGFTRKPSTPWYDDNGNFAGIVHQERGWTYVLFDGASHLVPQKKPDQAFVFLREFVLGSNQTGLVVNSSSTVSVVGGESSALAGDFLPGGDVYGGSPSSITTYTYPAATVSAWNAVVSSIVSAETPARTSASLGLNAGSAMGPAALICAMMMMGFALV